MSYLPTYEDCLRICKSKEGAFYENQTLLDGYKISLFNYNIAQYTDFTNPIEGEEDINAFELRGIGFVFNKDGSLFKRFLLLNKFFNINQVPCTHYDLIKNYTIKDINIKEDGSIISFVDLPNGNVYAKSKMSFISEQAIGANNVYNNNPFIKKFVNDLLKDGFTPIFEYVSPRNRIVLQYTKDDLILLRVRNNSNGSYVDLRDLSDKTNGITVNPYENGFTLDELIEKCDVEENKEGYVIHSIDLNGNDFFFKLKTQWYFKLHNLFTNDLNRENIIIEYILNDSIDDILTQVPLEDKVSRDRIERITEILSDEINVISKEIEKLYDIYLSLNKDLRIFGKEYNKNTFFSYTMSFINTNGEKTLYDLSKEFILRRTKNLMESREWLLSKDDTIFKTFSNTIN